MDKHPTTTRAVIIDHFDDAPHLGEIPLPPLSPTDVLIGVRAASINAFDWKLADGLFRDNFTYVFPVTVGRDYSGVIEAVGEQVTRVSVGDEVFGYLSGTELHRGSYADHVRADESECFVPKPAGLDHGTAACLPLCGVVALRSVEAVDPSAGDVVLVVGAPGGVGSYAVQLAAAQGAHVIATGLPEDEQYLKDLGAAEIVPPDDTLIPEITRRHPDGIGGLIDLVHYREAFLEQLDVVASGGRVASLHRAADDELLEARGLKGTNVNSMPDRGLLERLGEMAELGTLRVPTQGTFSLERAADGLAVLKEQHARGKLVITTR